MKNKEAKSIFSSLEHLSSTPPPELWANIEAKLDEPKKKKRHVIWWWAAACIMAGLSLPAIWYANSNQGNNLELNIEDNANEVVLQNDSNVTKTVIEKAIEKSTDDLKNIDANNEESIVEKPSGGQINNNSSESKNNNLNSKNTSVATKIVPVNSYKTKDSEIFKNSNQEKQNQSIAQSNDKLQSDAMVVNKKATASIYNSTSVATKNNSSQVSNSNVNTKTLAIVEKNNSVSDMKQKTEGVKNANSKSTPTNQNFEVSGFNSNKAIAENTKAKDSIIIKKELAQLENALVALDKDKKKEKKSSEVIDKWSLQVFAGVMGSENYNNEKSLGNTVASKQSNGYGVKTNYKLNKKWAVSSGFKINELGQKIDGVSYYERQDVQTSKVGALPLASSDNMQIGSSSINNNIVFVSDNENYLFAANSNSANGFETGNVTQSLKYFEMPVEVSYALLSKKKTNISMNTGGFVGKLISNEVLLNGSSIGENKSVNEYVYGTVLSSTLQYEIFKKTKFFIEPGMNYYINPLENQSFNQFQWMFNVGLNVSF